MTHQPFDDLSDVYESLVDWPKRLAREASFYRRLFADHDVQRVVDVACGTGHHAAMFYDWELHVNGSDVNSAMIEQARHQFGEPSGLSWTVRSFETPLADETPADAVICVGNSLALAADLRAAQTAVCEMVRAVRPGGIVIVHVLNLWSLPDGPCVWQKCIQYERTGGRALVTKGVHRSGDRGYVDLVVSSIEPPALLTTQSVPLLGLTAEAISQWAQEAGAASVKLLGDYQRTTYDQDTSVDLIAVIERGEGQ